MIKWTTAGESHGRGLVAVLEGIPAGLKLSPADVNADLTRRQKGYGRGGRMRIERDQVSFSSGLRGGATLGSPISMWIENKDWENWTTAMDPTEKPTGPKARPVTAPRPGHADLAGHLKFGHDDLRNVLERASARETAARVAIGAVCKKFLAEFGVEIGSEVLIIGGEGIPQDEWMTRDPLKLRSKIEASDVHCADKKAAEAMRAVTKKALHARDTVGGVFTVVAQGLPPGLGSYTRWDERLDTRLAAALMSIPAIKAAEVGLGMMAAYRFGSAVHDPIVRRGQGDWRRTRNNAGGLEGGTTNGQPLIVRAAMKPISTLSKPLASADIRTGKKVGAAVERSDASAVPAAAIVGEAMVAIELAAAWREKFGGDSLEEIRATVRAYEKLVARRLP